MRGVFDEEFNLLAGRRLVRRSVVVEADDACHLPTAIFELPELYELRVADILGVVGMRKSMHADLDCAVAFEWIDFQGSCYEFALNFAADVVLYRIEQALFAHR